MENTDGRRPLIRIELREPLTMCQALSYRLSMYHSLVILTAILCNTVLCPHITDKGTKEKNLFTVTQLSQWHSPNLNVGVLASQSVLSPVDNGKL